jgi:hypothetical protein
MTDSGKTPLYVGSSGSLALFSMGEKAIVLDLDYNIVVGTGFTSTLSSHRDWEVNPNVEVPKAALELAQASLTDLSIKVVTAAATTGRMYTIPKGAQEEAKKALEWHAEHHRGGTPVGLNTARILARGGQIGIHKVRHIAKYFPRHEVDKKGKGWKPGEDGFPSNGRIAWALWGSDTAWRWAQAIVERENKAAKTASGALTAGADLDSFKKAFYLDPMSAPDFLIRVRLDGSGIDRLYKIDTNGEVYVWDDGSWDDLGAQADVWDYDKALDDPYDLVEKSHLPVDPDSAIIIAARMQQNPYGMVSVGDIDADEAALAMFAASEMDWDVIDYTLTAAGASAGDGVYTPQEHSAHAQQQIRSSLGRFSPENKPVDPKAQLPNSNEDSNIDLKKEKTQPMDDLTRPLDTSGILGEPREPINQPYAHTPGLLPALTAGDLHDIMYNWDGWVQSQRADYGSGLQSSGAPVDEQPVDEPEEHDENDNKHTHPLLQKWLLNRDKPSTPNPDDDWAKTAISAAGVAPAPLKTQAKQSYQMTPKTSDVKPLYFAIVADDDPRAVLSLISIVPASSTSTSPMVYKRVKGKWVRDAKTLNDLKSATPPPVIPLTPKVLNDVLLQVDKSTMTASGIFDVDHLLMVLWGPRQEIMETYGEQFFDSISEKEQINDTFKAVFSLAAAGGLDRNRGNAERLRHYWTHGEGALKIRWGMPGDWSRCVRHLAKYLGVRAKGYCQLRHKEATGMYTATHAKLDRARHHEHSAEEFIMEEVLTKNYGKKTVVTDKDMLMPIEDIMKNHDDLYDETWTPSAEMEELMNDAGCREEMCNFSTKSDHEEDDPCWDGYRQIGFKDKNGRHVPNCVRETSVIVAAGGLDRNRGGAEKLRHYWTVGEGALKIRWNTGGDWTRCVRHLAKYLGPRAKGYCALRHKEMTGMWTGDKTHRQLYGRKKNGKNVFSTEFVNSTAEVLTASAVSVKAELARERFGLVASAIQPQGASFCIPLVVPEDMESGDGRRFKKNAISHRELPLPLMWQIKTAEGHLGSVVVGRIDKLERTSQGIGNAYGVFDTGIHGQEAERLVRSGFLRGISADMDQFEATEEKPTLENAEDESEFKKAKILINKARVMGATIVAKPAFQECSIHILPNDNNQLTLPKESTKMQDGIYVDEVDAADAQALVACGVIASVIPTVPPAEWFENPKLSGPTPLTVDDMGRVFGHIAAWHVDHIGLTAGTKPPRSKSNYAYFHTGVVRADDGKDYPVGQLTLAGGHASLEASAYEAVKHYDDTASAIADVHAGEDAYGIWVAGALRPSAAPEQIRALRASAPSGDWRPIRGALELVAVCQVNVPGFPIARARVASGAVMALVAAGAMTLAKMKADPINELRARLDNLEKYGVPKEDLAARVASLKSRVDEAKTEFTYIPRDQREKLAKEGKALPDGSFPIENVEDVRAAIHAYGRAKDSHKADVRKHIEKRARQLNVRHLIPENWKTAETDAVTASAQDIRTRLEEFTAISELASISEAERKNLAKKGKALPDGSYPIRNEHDLKNAIKAFGRANPEDRDEVKAHIKKRARALGKVKLVPEDWMTESDMTYAVSQFTSLEALGKTFAAEDDSSVAVAPATDAPAAEVAPAPVAEIPVTPQDSAKYVPGVNQPRDNSGRFLDVLARLKSDLGPDASQDVVTDVQKANKLAQAGNYAQSVEASQQLLKTLDELNDGALNSTELANVKTAASELGKIVTNLPLPFKDPNAKMRYSDLPPVLKNLLDNMVDRVNKKIGKEDGAKATSDVREFMSGSELFNQSDLSTNLAKMLRLLT